MAANSNPTVRLTPQRQWVFDCICHQPHHLDADSIYHLAKDAGHTISLATIYRSLAYLKDCGLIEEHKLGKDHSHFEPAETRPHYHFTCQQCGRVIEFELPAVQREVQKLAGKEGHSVTSIQLLVNGICHDCKFKNR